MRRTLAIATLLILPSLDAQQQVTLGAVATHRLAHPAPVLPRAAQDAMVDGTVDLRITIDATGHVTAAQVVDGPELLRDTAIITVRRWTFRPFRNAQGKPAVASGMVEMSFTLPPEDAQRRSAMRTLDDQTQAKFFLLQDKCHADVRAGVASAASTACLDAAALASQFNPQARFIERRSVYVFAAVWLLLNNDGEKALPYAQLAVQEIQKGHDDDSGSNKRKQQSSNETNCSGLAANNSLPGIGECSSAPQVGRTGGERKR